MKTKRNKWEWHKSKKHTPGQWTVSYSSSHSSHQTFDVDMRNPKFEEKEANAKLIAAAPELLEALETALSFIKDNALDLAGSRFDADIKEIESAIKKATE